MKQFSKQTREVLAPGGHRHIFFAIQFPMFHCVFSSQRCFSHDSDVEEEEENPSDVTKGGGYIPKYFNSEETSLYYIWKPGQ